MKAVSGKEFTHVLERNGWKLIRIRGSHHIYAKPGLPARISVPVHGNQSLKSGLLNFFLKTVGLKGEDLQL